MPAVKYALLICIAILVAGAVYVQHDYSPSSLALAVLVGIIYFSPSVVMLARHNELTREFLEINIFLCWNMICWFILFLTSIYHKELTVVNNESNARSFKSSHFAMRLGFSIIIISIISSVMLAGALFTYAPPDDSWMNSYIVGVHANTGFVWPLSAIGATLFWKLYNPWI